MQRQLVEDLHRYFSALKQRSAEEESLRLRLEDELPCFDITSVHRDDLEGSGLDASCVTDAQMDTIASYVGVPEKKQTVSTH